MRRLLHPDTGKPVETHLTPAEFYTEQARRLDARTREEDPAAAIWWWGLSLLLLVLWLAYAVLLGGPVRAHSTTSHEGHTH